MKILTRRVQELIKHVTNVISENTVKYMMDPKLDMYLHVDASEYAMGRYLYQIKGGAQKVILFFGKDLDETIKRWAVYEK